MSGGKGTGRTRRAARLIAAGACFAALASSVAFGAVGGLSDPSCIKNSAPGECASGAPGLAGAYAVAVSPDGKYVYAAGFSNNSVVKFSRNRGSGALTEIGCVQQGIALECAEGVPALSGPTSLAFSPDGKSLYVAASGSDALLNFNRNVTTGALTAFSCVKDGAAGDCGAAAPGLDGVRSVAVSPDGKSVYAVSSVDDAIVRFTRNLATGALSAPSCIKDGSAGECASAAPGLDGANSVEVSPDGKSVYVAATGDDAVVTFARNRSTGALSSPSCVQNAVPSECSASAPGLADAYSVAVSPEGRSVYVASYFSDAIVTLVRDPATGALSAGTCIEDASPVACSAAAPGLDGADAVEVSPDGRSVYVTADIDDAIVSFNRNPVSGALSSPSCIKDAVAGECATAAPGLEAMASAAVSPDGRSVYGAARIDNTVVTFTRDAYPQTAITGGTKPRVRVRVGRAPGALRRARIKIRYFFTSSDPGSTFRCKLDFRPYRSCGSGQAYRVGLGTHKFRVIAIDPAQNADPSPALRTVRVAPRLAKRR